MPAGFEGPPPLPPSGGGPGAPSYSSTMGPSEAGPAPMTSGMSQAGTAAMKMAMEIDMAMKVLAQMVPQLAPWAEQSASQLREQLSAAINGGSLPTEAAPSDNMQFPGGEGLL